MRFWHQSATNLTHETKYRENIINHAHQVLGPDIHVVPHGIPLGMFGKNNPQEALRVPYMELLYTQAAKTAEKEGFDALAIGCNLNVGIRNCRTKVGIPVVGVIEACMHASCFQGRKFAFVTLGESLVDFITAEAEENGIRDKMACVLIVDEPIMNYIRRVNEANPATEQDLIAQNAEKAKEIFMRACRKAISQGAEVLIPGEGIFNEFVYEYKITECDGVPVLDANAALWNYAMMMVHYQRIMNDNVNKAYVDRKPDEELMKTMVDYFANNTITSADFS